MLEELARRHSNVRALRLNRNYGAHLAISAAAVVRGGRDLRPRARRLVSRLQPTLVGLHGLDQKRSLYSRIPAL
jgi:hypothetical protein